MTTLPRPLALAMLAILFAAFASGCGHELFSNPSNTTESRIDKYYDGDSAVQTTENRRKAADMGFGFPTGNPDQ